MDSTERDSDGDLLTTREAAKMFRMSPKQFVTLMKRRDIRPLQLGAKVIRWDRDMLEKWKEFVKKQPHLAWDQ